MNRTLMNRLIEKRIVQIETELEVEYDAINLSGYAMAKGQGTFSIQSIIVGRDLLFEVMSTADGSRRKIGCDAIRLIDGMDPVRLAGIHNIAPDGTLRTPGKRRGRKPKVRPPTDQVA